MIAKRLALLRNRRLQSLAVALGLSASMLTMGSGLAANDTVVVSANITSRLSITIQDQNANFGTGLGPDGLGTFPGNVTAVTSNAGNRGAYYIWAPNSTGDNITVRSNAAWNGSVAATENSNSPATITIANGSLRYRTSIPASYNAANNGTAFTTAGAAPSGWTGHTSGVSTFHYYVLLRVDWDDAISDFDSVVTYVAVA
jgi:hypothetical protein